MTENESRTVHYRKDDALEGQLKQINEALRVIACAKSEPVDPSTIPIVFVIGVQRSGTTLMMQLLSSCFRLTYPDNVVARFWKAPHIGLIISKSLRKQLGDGERETVFESDYGVTRSVFDPHEFGYFWSDMFPFEDSHFLDARKLKRVDWDLLAHDLQLMWSVGGDPLLFKIVPLSFICDVLAEKFGKSLFIFTQRDPLFVVQSTYLARLKRYGSESTWWSLKPKAYTELVKLEPIHQVAGQVFHSVRDISKAYSRIPRARRLECHYSRLCASPRQEMDLVGSFLKQHIRVEEKSVTLPAGFSNRDRLQVPKERFVLMQRAYKDFESTFG